MRAAFLLRRGDGRVLAVSSLLHQLVADIDGYRSIDDIASRLSTRLGRRVSADNVRFLIDHKLTPLRIVVDSADAEHPPDGRRRALGLRLGGALLPQRMVEAASTTLSGLFRPFVVAAVLTALVAFDLWLFAVHGVGSALDQLASEPSAMVGAYLLLALCGMFHELGHAAGGRYGGARPGRIGFGVYLIWPAFFSDMTDSYRLSRGGRLRTDLGGVYFNGVFVLACATGYGVTGWEPFLASIVLQHALVAYQFLPFVRLDGYYLASDLIGVPDLFSHVRPVLRSVVSGRAAIPEVRDLRPSARILVTIWVLLTVPLLLGITGLALFHAPDLFQAITGAFRASGRDLDAAFKSAQWASAAVAVLQLAMLAVVPLGLALTALGVLRRVGRWRPRARPRTARSHPIPALTTSVAVKTGSVDTGRPSVKCPRRRRLLAIGAIAAVVLIGMNSLRPQGGGRGRRIPGAGRP